MASDFPYLYPYSRTEARHRKETQRHEDSFRLNVSCARAIEQAIREHFNEEGEKLDVECAQSVLEQYGFKRVSFVLTNRNASIWSVRKPTSGARASRFLRMESTTAISWWIPLPLCWKASLGRPGMHIRRWNCLGRNTVLAAGTIRTMRGRSWC